MARKLKTFTTSAGFFDLAVAAPSMKAALEAWGAESNLFQQGFAQESNAVDVVTATMANPGVVLRRPVGTKQAFAEKAEVSDAFVDRTRRPPSTTKAKPKAQASAEAAPSKSANPKAGRRAALAYQRQAAKKERERRREEAALQKERDRRERTIAAAEAALREAEEGHAAIVKEIDAAQAALDRRSNDERTRWKARQEKLQDAVREARSPRHLRVVT